jgi:hypothetical protein
MNYIITELSDLKDFNTIPDDAPECDSSEDLLPIYNSKYYKFLHKDLTHNGFKYKLGLNVDTIPFYTLQPCSAGGLYFTTPENLWRYSHFGSLIGEVEIPPDAKIHFEDDKAKADKIIIKSITHAKYFFRGIRNKETYYKFAEQIIQNDIIPFSEITRKIIITYYKFALLYINRDIVPFDIYVEIYTNTKSHDVLAFMDNDKKLKLSMIFPELVKHVMCVLTLENRESFIYEFINKHPKYITCIPKRSRTWNILLEAFNEHPATINLMPYDKLTYDICLRAIEKDPSLWTSIPKKFRINEIKNIINEYRERPTKN